MASSSVRIGKEEAGDLDEAALHEFVHAQYPRLVGAVAVICGSRATAEDAVQEALARAWERDLRGEYIESIPAWVTTVSVNLARSGLRRLRAERRARERLLPGLYPSPPSTESQLDLRRALGKLPRRQREATVLRYYLGLEVLEVAAAMRIPEGTAKSLLSRARVALARALDIQNIEEVSDRGQD
jgi:RNA polymerase sigma factor (sigma-70 family)